MSDDDTIPGKLEDIKHRLDLGEERMAQGDLLRTAMAVKIDEQGKKLDAHDLKLDMIIKGMAENTAITKTVSDVLTTARVGRTVLIWAAGIATSCAALWGVLSHMSWKP